ncbi:MAG: hypothetical protein E3J72_15640 [Planctomycetota bacterium]|nr:MAG: hypothetical protein E3J72_15640 [Planctomycetota bacterium]
MDEKAPEKTNSTPTPPAAPKAEPVMREVLVRPMPTILLLWPVTLMALVFGIMASFKPFGIEGIGDEGNKNAAIGLIFTLVFFANLLTLFVQFTSKRTVILAIFIACLLALAIFINASTGTFWQKVGGFFRAIGPEMSNRFYFVWFGLLVIINLAAYLNALFDYWIIRPSELIHHHGVAGKTTVYKAPRLRVEKEIPDVLSYVLLRSGRLVVYTSAGDKPIMLENLIGVNSVMRRVSILAELDAK